MKRSEPLLGPGFELSRPQTPANYFDNLADLCVGFSSPVGK